MNISKLVLLSFGGVFFSSALQAGIVSSKHNLSSSGLSDVGAGTARICVFCHTPHGGDTGAKAPLWNKVLPASSTFQTYDTLGTSTLDGSVDLDSGGISLACLSCHDGTSALDLVLNAPTTGPGIYNYNPAGQNIGTGVTMLALTGAVNNTVPVLGKDLRNDHPVGIQYAGGGLTWAAIMAGNNVADSAGDKLFNDPIWDASTSRLWVGAVGGDGLPLYGGVGNTFGPTVECASCHNPHKTDYGTFLRKSNDVSALCLTCHIK
ncbi:MAG: cytochrome c [Thiomicrorhabdus sp.]|nr:MAG: cytochrome c [Thiomicrorhabdus sp.]